LVVNFWLVVLLETRVVVSVRVVRSFSSLTSRATTPQQLKQQQQQQQQQQHHQQQHSSQTPSEQTATREAQTHHNSNTLALCSFSL